jgi:hypothetical protein
MRTTIRVTELNRRQWSWLQSYLQTSYEFAPFEPRVCVVFDLSALERHVEMPLPTFSGLMMVLQSLGMADTAQAALSPDELPDYPTRRPVLPTPAQVRDLTAQDAAALAREMNEPGSTGPSYGAGPGEGR